MKKSAYQHYVKWTIGAAMLSAAAGLVLMPSLAPAGEGPNKDEVFTLRDTIAIGPNALVSFDISWVDASLHRYYLADRSNKAVDVVDTTSHTLVTQLQPPAGDPQFAGFTGNNDTSGPNGVLTFNNKGTNEAWAGNGPTTDPVCPSAAPFSGVCSTVKVFNLSTGALIQDIPTNGHERADELCYDPADHLIQIANDAEEDSGNPPFVSFISTDTYKVLGTLKFPNATNGIEQCQYNSRNGMIYLNIPEVSGSGNDTTDGNVVVINPKTMSVVKTFDIPVAKCAGPQGMALGPSNQILLGCNAIYPFVATCNATTPCPAGTVQNAAIINENSGVITHLLKGLGGNDEVWYNDGDGHYFLAEGSLLPNEQLGVVDSSGARPDQSVFIGNAGVTTRRAHSVAADSNTNEVFLPIPATGGGSPGFTSTVCGSDLAADGCIAVFKANHDDHSKFVHRPDDDGDDHGNH
jgi:hypothetical protein